jgi:hypothetical protein
MRFFTMESFIIKPLFILPPFAHDHALNYTDMETLEPYSIKELASLYMS